MPKTDRRQRRITAEGLRAKTYHHKDSIYKEAWTILYSCLGERMQDEALELMDSVLQSVKLEHEEYKQCIRQGDSKDTKG